MSFDQNSEQSTKCKHNLDYSYLWDLKPISTWTWVIVHLILLVVLKVLDFHFVMIDTHLGNIIKWNLITLSNRQIFNWYFSPLRTIWMFNCSPRKVMISDCQQTRIKLMWRIVFCLILLLNTIYRSNCSNLNMVEASPIDTLSSYEEILANYLQIGSLSFRFLSFFGLWALSDHPICFNFRTCDQSS